MPRHDRLLAAVTVTVALLAGACVDRAPAWVRTPAARYGTPVALPAPSTAAAGTPLDDAIAQRRSARSFRPEPLSLATLGQLLWAGQGITGPDGKRAAPSAGGLYPLELYVVTPTEVIHYLPEGHRVETRAVPDVRPRLRSASFGQEAVGDAPDVIVVAAAPDRTRQKYGARSDGFVAMEAGHATQNILLEAAALGLAAVPVGGIDPRQAALALPLPPGQTVLYLVPVGPPS